jgi:hypothetical protein
MAGYIGSKTSVTQVDGYNRNEADAEFVNDPNSVISVSGSNVGIGTSFPGQLLHVNSGSVNTTARFESTDSIVSIELKDNTGSAYLNSTGGNLYTGGNFGIGVVPVSSWDTFTALQIEGSSLGALGDNNTILGSNIYHDNNAFKYIGTAAATVYQQRLGEHRWSGAASGTAGNTANMTQHMTLDSSGNVGIGRTPSYRLDVDSNAMGASGRFNRYTDGSLRSVVIFRSSSNGSDVGGVYINNTSTSYNTSSDYRLKEDVQPMTGASARVQALNPVNFEWISDGTRVDGFLAHEAQEVVPEAVTGTKDAMRDEEYEVTPAVLDEDGNVVTEAVMGTRSVPDYQGIDQSKLVPLLTAALQEALTEIADLKARVTALEAV